MKGSLARRLGTPSNRGRHDRTIPLLVTLLGLCPCLSPGAPILDGASDGESGIYSLADFGVAGDGQTDDTRALQTALDTAANEGGGVVFLPRGRFRVEGRLTIPSDVTLEGLARYPPNRIDFATDDLKGSVLLAFAGRGEPDGEPFLTLQGNATLRGVTIVYPEQTNTREPIPYPWTVRCAGNNVAVLDCLLLNPYQALDFGTYAHGRHLIRNVYGQPLLTGLYIDQCYDVGRVENIHFWPFWSGPNLQEPVCDFMRERGTAFRIGRTDGQMMLNCFSIYYRTGMHFVDTGYGPGSGVYTGCYMDICPTAVRVDSVQGHAGVSFVNGMFMSGVEVAPTNLGPVKFSGCGFWPLRGLESHAVVEGRGPVFFESCHFSGWDQQRTGAPCIDANAQRIVVTGCDFETSRTDHLKVRLGAHTHAAIVAMNLMPGGALIENRAGPRAAVEIAMNATTPPRRFVDHWLVLGPFPNPGAGKPWEAQRSRRGFDTDFLADLGGEARARLDPRSEVSVTDAEGNARRVRSVVVPAERATSILSFSGLFRSLKGVAYAACVLDAQDDTTGFFEFGSNDCAKVWVNGTLVHEQWAPGGRGCLPGNDLFEAPLSRGANAVLIKVEDAGGSSWSTALEVYDEEGRPVPSRPWTVAP